MENVLQRSCRRKKLFEILKPRNLTAEPNRPVADERVLPKVAVGGGQRQQQLPLLGVLLQDAAGVAAGAELRSDVVDVGEFDCDCGDVLVAQSSLLTGVDLLQLSGSFLLGLTSLCGLPLSEAFTTSS